LANATPRGQSPRDRDHVRESGQDLGVIERPPSFQVLLKGFYKFIAVYCHADSKLQDTDPDYALYGQARAEIDHDLVSRR